jgi:hypothetical protein
MLDFQGLYFIIIGVLVRIYTDITSLKAIECFRRRSKGLREELIKYFSSVFLLSLNVLYAYSLYV